MACSVLGSSRVAIAARRSLRAKIAGRLQRTLRRTAERALERRFGVDTSGFVYLDDLGLDTEERVWHDPSEWLSLRRALRRLEPTERDVLVDLGSGKGRGVFVAALEFPFRRVIGVEIAEELNAVARANVERNRERLRCREVELITADVLDYELPDDVTIVYLFSPFVGEVFQRVIERIIAAVDASPRPLRILYSFPFEHNRLIDTGRVEVVDVQPGHWPLRDRARPDAIVTYAVVPREHPELAAPFVAGADRRLRGAEQWRSHYDPGFVISRPGRTLTPSGVREAAE